MSLLKIAVQKSGRLSEKSLKLLDDCGIKLGQGERKLKALSDNFPIEVLFLRDDDIPQYVEQGVADLGILGENEVLEKNKNVRTVEKLGFASCRMSLAIPKDEKYSGLHDFEGKRIATSYPHIIRQFFLSHNVNVVVEEIGGSVEIATGIGLADAIFDIVSTGSTLLMNGLREVELVLKSEAVLISYPDMAEDKKKILEQLLFRIRAVNTAREYKYILLNAPNDKVQDIIKILPGMKAPTLLPLSQEGWSSLHSVIKEQDFWEVIDQLKSCGAEGILVAPIEKMIL